ncbi:ROK family transcriptional regulator [Actinomadura rudentiformis]|uniref:ROK family transcriptional regulator n=1 Tax=Actinomadura rudentiformis TaxID=359158 RepID=A0A6H9YDC6_9ACTN|nr:ROK family transcriptional regulator [Actinomadura rudentiformis]KAB2341597.1 ROK family transcriptional regulator [Actinomadura rudentiformis]
MAFADGPATPATVRRHNARIVLGKVRAHGTRSRADLARDTGLVKAAVSAIVADLIEAGLLAETAPAADGGRGRPVTLLRLDGGPAVALGVEINVDFVNAVAVTLSGEVVLRERIAARAPSPEEARATLTALVDRLDRPLLGVCLAVPGLVDPDTATVRHAPNLRWRDVRVADWLPGGVGCDNDANLAVVAEHRRGSPVDSAYLTGTIGIGAGLLLNGRVYRGGFGYAGEIGHMPIAGSHARCGCGRTGCWEAVVGLEALRQRTALAAGDRYDDKVAAIAQRAEAGEPRVLDALREHGVWLGRGAAVLINLVNPRALILGGFFADLAPWFLDTFRAELDAHVLAADLAPCELRLSTLGVSAASLGAADLVLNRIFADPLVRRQN